MMASHLYLLLYVPMVLYEQRKCFMQGYIMSTSMIVIQILDSFVTGQYYLHHKYRKKDIMDIFTYFITY
jgi:hypothetical protein